MHVSAIDVKRVMTEVLDLNVEPGDLEDQLSLFSTTIHLDSLTLLRLLTVFEKWFSCEIDDEAVMTADLVDVRSLVELVLSQIGAPTADIGGTVETV